MVPKICEGFTNRKGIHYDRVREIAYRHGELAGNLGTFVAETKHENNMFFDSSHNLVNGVYIYQSYFDPLVAYRIYKSFADYGFNGYNDDRLVQILRERQENINLSKFPTGVVTLDGSIIGQEIPYFPNKITLYKLFLEHKKISPIKIYRAVLDVLNEMYDNGIIYLDNHPKNFMVDPTDPASVDVIDFDETYVKFDDDSETLRRQLFDNYKVTVDGLNQICGIDSLVGKFESTSTFEDAYKQLGDMEKRLVR